MSSSYRTPGHAFLSSILILCQKSSPHTDNCRLQTLLVCQPAGHTAVTRSSTTHRPNEIFTTGVQYSAEKNAKQRVTAEATFCSHFSFDAILCRCMRLDITLVWELRSHRCDLSCDFGHDKPIEVNGRRPNLCDLSARSCKVASTSHWWEQSLGLDALQQFFFL